METKFKSSFFATTVQYIVTPIIVVSFFYLASYYFNNIGQNTKDFNEIAFYLPVLFWASVYMVFSIYQLRYINVLDDNLIIKALGGRDEIINYNDIEWINQSGIGSSWYIITIKYKNKETGKSKIIYALPEIYTRRETLSVLNPFTNLQVTKFIREKIINVKPEYKIENEPSRWYLPKKIFLSLLPFLVLYFFIK